MYSNHKLTDSIEKISDIGYTTGSILDLGDLKKAQEIIACHISKLNNEITTFEDILLFRTKGLQDIAINKSKRIFSIEDAELFLTLPQSRFLYLNFQL
jgi:hypothetical protein